MRKKISSSNIHGNIAEGGNLSVRRRAGQGEMADTLESATMEAKPLGGHHQEQIASFLRFAAYKRDQQVKEINVIFDEMTDSRSATRLVDEAHAGGARACAACWCSTW